MKLTQTQNDIQPYTEKYILQIPQLTSPKNHQQSVV